jgi:hypothetical protein
VGIDVPLALSLVLLEHGVDLFGDSHAEASGLAGDTDLCAPFSRRAFAKEKVSTLTE